MKGEYNMAPLNKIKISCLMLTRNLISQGYPFVETILSVIPYCEEMIICEGYSNDGTYEVLRKLEKSYDNKIILKREKWVGKKDLGDVFAQILNDAKEESSGDYILKLDPDHVFVKDTIEDLILIVKANPKREMFILPYLYFVGNWIIKPEKWGNFFFKNSKDINIVRDSGVIKFTPVGFLKFTLKNINHPKQILKFMRGVYVPTTPVYHYYALFPGNYLTRIEEHKKFYKKYDWSPYDKVLKKLEEIKDWEKFWEVVAKEIVEKTWTWYGIRKVVKYSGNPPLPPLIKPLWGQWKYKVREELINSNLK